MAQIIPTAEPFFYPGERTGCLLVHGFTGSPKEMHGLGAHLAAQGYSVLGVRLAGHATRSEDLLRTRWQDWLLSVEDGYRLLSGAADRIFVLGLSMGGALALLFTARAGSEVAGVVGMSTIYSLPQDPRLPYIRLLSWFVPRVPKGPPDWRDLQAGQDHVHYPFYPTRSIVELRSLLVEVRLSLPHVCAPALLVHSRSDTGVPAENAQAIYDSLGSQEKNLVWVEDSGHVITRDRQRETVFRHVSEFIQHHSETHGH